MLGQFRKQGAGPSSGAAGAPSPPAAASASPGFISEPVRPRDKHHMTGKPTAVMRFLARFVTPGGLILDPCAGSGSTGVGALLEGRRFVRIEQDAHYAQVAAKRLRETAAGRGWGQISATALAWGRRVWVKRKGGLICERRATGQGSAAAGVGLVQWGRGLQLGGKRGGH